MRHVPNFRGLASADRRRSCARGMDETGTWDGLPHSLPIPRVQLTLTLHPATVEDGKWAWARNKGLAQAIPSAPLGFVMALACRISFQSRANPDYGIDDVENSISGSCNRPQPLLNQRQTSRQIIANLPRPRVGPATLASSRCVATTLPRRLSSQKHSVHEIPSLFPWSR